MFFVPTELEILWSFSFSPNPGSKHLHLCRGGIEYTLIKPSDPRQILNAAVLMMLNQISVVVVRQDGLMQLLASYGSMDHLMNLDLFHCYIYRNLRNHYYTLVLLYIYN